MKVKINKNKCFLFVIGSWLIVKLWWAFEMSRLAFFRNVPQSRVNQVVYASNLPHLSHWIYEENQFSVLNYDNESQSFIITKLHEITQS